MKIGETVTISISRIANGFLVREELRDPDSYSSVESPSTYYDSIPAIESVLVERFEAARDLEISHAKADF